MSDLAAGTQAHGFTQGRQSSGPPRDFNTNQHQQHAATKPNHRLSRTSPGLGVHAIPCAPASINLLHRRSLHLRRIGAEAHVLHHHLIAALRASISNRRLRQAPPADASPPSLRGFQTVMLQLARVPSVMHAIVHHHSSRHPPHSSLDPAPYATRCFANSVNVPLSSLIVDALPLGSTARLRIHRQRLLEPAFCSNGGVRRGSCHLVDPRHCTLRRCRQANYLPSPEYPRAVFAAPPFETCSLFCILSVATVAVGS